MNERIKELLVKAGVEKIIERESYIDDEPNGYMESDLKFMEKNRWAVVKLIEGGGLEKFAELIVRECIEIAENSQGDLDFTIWKIKKDFGVE